MSARGSPPISDETFRCGYSEVDRLVEYLEARQSDVLSRVASGERVSLFLPQRGCLDAGRAVKATAHQLARLVYAMLTRGEEYVAREIADYEAERRDRQVRHLQRQARRYNLELVEAAA